MTDLEQLADGLTEARREPSSINKTGFVNWTYKPSDGALVSKYLDTFVRRAIGLQCRRFFIGLIFSNPQGNENAE